MATTSRYAPVGTAPTNTSSSGNTSSTSNTNTSGTSDSSTNSSGSTNSQNMDPKSLAALNAIIAQLQGGGTAGMRQDSARRATEVAQLQQNRDGYSKEAAFADAKGLIAQTMAQALEKTMPGINSGSLGAGSSQSSMRALLMQKATENAAQAASAQGLQAAVNYGGVANGINNTIAQILGIQDPAAAALINALAVSKGAVTSTQTQNTSNTVGSTTGTSSGTTTGTTSSNSASGPTIGGSGGSTSGSSGSSGPIYFGPVGDGGAYDRGASSNASSQALSDLVNEVNGNSFSGYTF